MLRLLHWRAVQQSVWAPLQQRICLWLSSLSCRSSSSRCSWRRCWSRHRAVRPARLPPDCSSGSLPLPLPLPLSQPQQLRQRLSLCLLQHPCLRQLQHSSLRLRQRQRRRQRLQQRRPMRAPTCPRLLCSSAMPMLRPPPAGPAAAVAAAWEGGAAAQGMAVREAMLAVGRRRGAGAVSMAAQRSRSSQGAPCSASLGALGRRQLTTRLWPWQRRWMQMTC